MLHEHRMTGAAGRVATSNGRTRRDRDTPQPAHNGREADIEAALLCRTIT